jgi:hypothetical protein
MYPINADLTRRINKEAFYSEIDAAMNERAWPKIAERIEQDVTSVVRVGMGSMPKPVQLSGTAGGGNTARVKSMKDFAQTTTVVEWDLSVGEPRSLVEDQPDEAARIGRIHGQSASVFFDERAIGQLDSTTALGYDGIALYSTGHLESGSAQDNAKTSAAATGTKPTAAELEAALEVNLPALRNFRDDQGRPVNEGVTRFTILIPPDFEWVYKGVLDPNLRDQAIDSSGVTGKFRGMFDIVVSAYVPTDRHDRPSLHLRAEPGPQGARLLREDGLGLLLQHRDRLRCLEDPSPGGVHRLRALRVPAA